MAAGLETPLVIDGHHGVWLGPYAHWSGTRWVGHEATSALACSMADFTRIPGQVTLRGVGAISRSPKRADTSSVPYAPHAKRWFFYRDPADLDDQLRRAEFQVLAKTEVSSSRHWVKVLART